MRPTPTILLLYRSVSACALQMLSQSLVMGLDVVRENGSTVLLWNWIRDWISIPELHGWRVLTLRLELSVESESWKRWRLWIWISILALKFGERWRNVAVTLRCIDFKREPRATHCVKICIPLLQLFAFTNRQTHYFRKFQDLLKPPWAVPVLGKFVIPASVPILNYAKITIVTLNAHWSVFWSFERFSAKLK